MWSYKNWEYFSLCMWWFVLYWKLSVTDNNIIFFFILRFWIYFIYIIPRVWALLLKVCKVLVYVKFVWKKGTQTTHFPLSLLMQHVWYLNISVSVYFSNITLFFAFIFFFFSFFCTVQSLCALWRFCFFHITCSYVILFLWLQIKKRIFIYFPSLFIPILPRMCKYKSSFVSV